MARWMLLCAAAGAAAMVAACPPGDDQGEPVLQPPIVLPPLEIDYGDIKISPPVKFDWEPKIEFPPLTIDLSNPPHEIVWPPVQQKRTDGMRVDRVFDFNGDGTPDIRILNRPGRGPLSTYTMGWWIEAVGDAAVLGGGRPMPNDQAIGAADILQGTQRATIHLFTAGGSLMFPDRHMREFSSGPWYGVSDRTLAVAIARADGALGIATIRMSVSEAGVLEVHAAEVRWVGLETSKRENADTPKLTGS